MTRSVHKRWVLARYPHGPPQVSDFLLTDAPVREPLPGEVRVRVIYLSMDPAPRMRMDPIARMGRPLPLGDVVIGRGAGVVEASNTSDMAEGDFVTGELGWQERAVVNATALQKVDCSRAPLSAYLGLLASSGLTADLVLRECARARATETVVVSAAAGSVGLAACQIARILDCRVVALAYGRAQAQFLLSQLRLDEVIDVADLDALAPKLAATCPSGVDVFLDSVGGALHNSVIEQISIAGRAVLYGFISAYNASAGQEPEYGRIYQIIKRRARLMGFLLADHQARFSDSIAHLLGWMHSGELQTFEHVSQGLQNAPGAFAELFAQAAPGKHLVQVSTDSSQQSSARN